MTRSFSPIAKISLPVFSGVFPRKKLFRALDKAMKRPSVWISGPAGCGKTALASTYLSARKIPCVWYRLDESDNDVASFFYYMGLAARAYAPGKGKTLPLLTPEYLPGLSTFSKKYFEDLFGRLTPRSVVVFDDYQKVGTQSLFHKAICDGLSRLPDGIHAFFISRGDPPPIFARERAHQRMEYLGWKELRLTPVEAKGITRLRGKKLNAGEVLSLQDRSDGWAAGFVLLLEETSGPGTERLKVTDTPPEKVFEYFAGEIFAALGEKTKNFLLKSACLPKMTARMAERITGVSRADTILSYLNRNNYFTEVHPHPEPVYEYHPLFREFLLARAREILPARHLRQILHNAGTVLEDAGNDEEAVLLYQDLGDREGVARIILRKAPRLILQGRSGTLAEWIDFLPETECMGNPWLLYWRGICRLTSGSPECRGDFEEAFRRFRRRKEPEGIFRALAGAVDAIVFGGASLKAVDAWFTTLSGLLRAHKRFPSPEVEAHVTCSVVKALALRRPPSVDMEKWVDRAMVLARATQDLPLKFSFLVNAAYFRFHSGDFPAMRLLLQSLREMVRKTEIPYIPRLAFFWLEAAHANMNGLREHCMTVVKEGLGFAETTGVHFMDHLLSGHGALCSLHMGDLPAATRLLEKMAASILTAKPWEACFYHNLAGWEALNRGDQAQALFHSDHSLGLANEVGNPWPEALAHLLRAFVLQRKGETEEAFRNLGQAAHLGKERGMGFVQFNCYLAEAWFRLCDGSDASALTPLREGLRQGRENGYVTIYMWCPGLLERIAAEALEKEIEPEYVRGLIRRNALLPDDTARNSGRWPWPIRIYTLGRFNLVVDGASSPSGRKAAQKPLQLLKALIALGGKEVPQEKLSERLWPDADGDLAHESLSSNLKRLRKLLRNDRSVLLRDGRITLNNGICWVDSWAFERIVGQTQAGLNPGAPVPDGPKIARIGEKAIALYRGPFLSEEQFCPDIVTCRVRLRSKFLRMVVLAGRHWEQSGEWETAVTCYQKGLEVDPLSEDLCRSLISCHLRMGRPAEAHAVYHGYRRMLSGVLGVSPPPDLEAILKAVPAVSARILP
jgi:LuxR family maltose regulon positive regulatory protein